MMIPVREMIPPGGGDVSAGINEDDGGRAKHNRRELRAGTWRRKFPGGGWIGRRSFQEIVNDEEAGHGDGRADGDEPQRTHACHRPAIVIPGGCPLLLSGSTSRRRRLGGGIELV